MVTTKCLAFAREKSGIEAILVSTLSVITLSLIAKTAVECGVVQRWYGAPFVALVAIVTSWKGRDTGALTALMSSAIMNFAFVPPADAFSIPTAAEATIYISMGLCVLGIRARPSYMPSCCGNLRALAYVRTGSVIVCDADFRPVYEIRDI